MAESADDYRRRERWLVDWAGYRGDHALGGPLDVAFTLEALGATPDGFARVLELAEKVRTGYLPAGLTNVARGYRIGVVPLGRSAGLPLGVYGDVMVVAWTTDL